MGVCLSTAVHGFRMGIRAAAHKRPQYDSKAMTQPLLAIRADALTRSALVRVPRQHIGGRSREPHGSQRLRIRGAADHEGHDGARTALVR